ncbi:MAG: hypothetical protein ACYTGQ_12825, partial [Planctomycetota bacterium]
VNFVPEPLGQDGSSYKASLNVLNGGAVRIPQLTTEGIGWVQVKDAGSSLRVSGDVTLDSAQVGVPSMRVISGGLVETNGLRIEPGASLELNGGTLRVNTFDPGDGDFQWPAGAIEFTNNLTIDHTNLGNALELGFGRALRVSGAATIPASSAVLLDGGQLTASTVDATGLLDFRRRFGWRTRNWWVRRVSPTWVI